MKPQRNKAEHFLSLHHAEHILVLPNCWDVPSARVFEDEGFPAIATSSAGLSVSLGYPDGEAISKTELFAAVRRIARTLTVPLSVDIESGFGSRVEELEDTVRLVIDAGGIGVNIEDIADFKAKSLKPMEVQVARIKAIRRVSDSLEIPLVINARTDAYRFGRADDETKLEETVERCKAYAQAGSDCLYPIGLTTKESISKVVGAVDKPVNVMARKGVPSITELEKLGVRRVSLGPGPSYAAMGLMRRIAQEINGKGTYHTLVDGAITFDELNALAAPRR